MRGAEMLRLPQKLEQKRERPQETREWWWQTAHAPAV